MPNNTRRWILDLAIWTLTLLAGTTLVSHEAVASGKPSSPPNTAWKAECGSCHLAYPPQLLPASSWRRVMSGLDRHFGTDATLDARAAREIGAFLEQSAGSGKRVRGVSDELRITETPWFVRKHREVPSTAWKRAAIGSAANCAACHQAAEQGDFDEHSVRIPR